MKVVLSILEKGAVTLCKFDPFHLGDPLEERRYHEILRSLLRTIDNERGASDRVETINDRPGL